MQPRELRQGQAIARIRDPGVALSQQLERQLS
jgi:hypothetical protein